MRVTGAFVVTLTWRHGDETLPKVEEGSTGSVEKRSGEASRFHFEGMGDLPGPWVVAHPKSPPKELYSWTPLKPGGPYRWSVCGMRCSGVSRRSGPAPPPSFGAGNGRETPCGGCRVIGVGPRSRRKARGVRSGRDEGDLDWTPVGHPTEGTYG